MHRFIILILFSGFIFSSCSSIEKIQGRTEDETYFLRGQAYMEDGSYEIAREKFLIVKNKFPYSPHLINAEFLLAKSSYLEGQYLRSGQEFLRFVELHPKHKLVSEAKYLRAMGFYNRLPSSEDRDLSLANPAIVAFKEAMSAEYGLDALEKITEIKRLKAKRVLYIANFYKKRDNCVSAIERYNDLINHYSFEDLNKEAREGIKECESGNE